MTQSNIPHQNGTARIGEIEQALAKLSHNFTFIRELGVIEMPYDEFHYDFDNVLIYNQRGKNYLIDESLDSSYCNLNISYSPDWVMEVKVFAFKFKYGPITPAELYNLSKSTSKYSIPMGIFGQMLACDQLRDQLFMNSIYATVSHFTALKDFHGNPVTTLLLTGNSQSEFPVIDTQQYEASFPPEALILFFFALNWCD